MKPAMIFRQYIWIINTLRAYKRLTFEEISRKWQDDEVADGNALQRSSFNRHRDAILDMFGIVIECEPKTYKYYISNPEVLNDDSIERWIFSTLTVHGVLADSASVKEYVVLESAPAGEEYLETIIRAIKTHHQLLIGYKAFGAEGYEKTLSPYSLKAGSYEQGGTDRRDLRDASRLLATGLFLRVLRRADGRDADGPRRHPGPRMDTQLPAHAAPAPFPARDRQHGALCRFLIRHPPYSRFPE